MLDITLQSTIIHVKPITLNPSVSSSVGIEATVFRKMSWWLEDQPSFTAASKIFAKSEANLASRNGYQNQVYSYDLLSVQVLSPVRRPRSGDPGRALELQDTSMFVSLRATKKNSLDTPPENPYLLPFQAPKRFAVLALLSRSPYKHACTLTQYPPDSPAPLRSSAAQAGHTKPERAENRSAPNVRFCAKYLCRPNSFATNASAETTRASLQS